VNLAVDEGLETGNVVDVKAESLTADGLENKVKVRLLEEAHLDLLDVGHGGHELQLDAGRSVII
jgi:hypothetical protein